METHEFTVVATGLDPAAPDFEARFLEAGCDDATVSFQKGRILVDFSRVAVSLEAAVNQRSRGGVRRGRERRAHRA